MAVAASNNFSKNNLKLILSDYWTEVLNFHGGLMQQAEICIVASVHHVFPLPLLPISFLSSPGLYPLPLQGCHSQSSSWSHISWLTWLLVSSAQIEVTLWHWSTSQKKDAVGAKYPKMFNSVSFLIFVEVSKEISHILQDHPRALFFYLSVNLFIWFDSTSGHLSCFNVGRVFWLYSHGDIILKQDCC